MTAEKQTAAEPAIAQAPLPPHSDGKISQDKKDERDAGAPLSKMFSQRIFGQRP